MVTPASDMATDISTHALREEGDGNAPGAPRRGKISTHALREEGDQYGLGTAALETLFLPTPSVRRATGAYSGRIITAPNFYPRPP